MLFQIAQALGATMRVTDVGALISTHLARLLPFTSSAVFLWDEASRSFSCEHATGSHQDAMRALTAPSVEGLQAALATLANLRCAGGPAPAESLLVAPLELDGRNIGALAFCHVDEHVYTSDHDRLVARVAAQSAPVVANAMLFSRAHQQSFTDSLTGLANRRFVERQLDREISRARRQASRFSVLFFDVDRFKGINDVFGHRAGDETLIAIGRFLQSSLRDYDVCARFGGDEFVVVLFDCDRRNAEGRLRSIQSGVAGMAFEPSPGLQVLLSLSGGAATYPADGANAEALIAAADRRMYEDKSARRRDIVAAPAQR
jgi:diguanylate cyclase (GGDEF)-like protein